jgi:hypothetical protein
MAKKRKRGSKSLIAAHLGGIQRALLEGERRPAFLEFLNQELPGKRGIYALYDKRGRLHYAGKASDLTRRLNQHLRDRHGESWERMTLFIVADSVNVSELEGLVVATARPPGNKQNPKIGQDLRESLQRYLRQDAHAQIDQAIYPERRSAPDVLTSRITNTKLRMIRQAKLAAMLGISQPQVSVLFKRGKIRQYIVEAGKRDAVLLLLHKMRKA